MLQKKYIGYMDERKAHSIVILKKVMYKKAMSILSTRPRTILCEVSCYSIARGVA